VCDHFCVYVVCFICVSYVLCVCFMCVSLSFVCVCMCLYVFVCVLCGLLYAISVSHRGLYACGRRYKKNCLFVTVGVENAVFL
jgi:hypothetical protein